MTNPRIFISCVSAEFRGARTQISQVLQFLGYEPVFQEIFGTESGDLRDVLRKKIDSCEGLIHFVGEAYGFEPTLAPDAEAPTPRQSYTQFEFAYARERGKKTWLLFAGPEAVRDTPVEQLDLPPAELNHADPAAFQAERRALQQAWQSRWQAEGETHLRHPFNTTAELENRIHGIKDQLGELRKKQKNWQALVLSLLFGLMLLGGGAFYYLKISGDALPDKIAQQQELTRAKIRVHLEEASQGALDRDLSEAESQSDWRERDRLRQAAEAAHAERLSRIGGLAEEFTRLEGSETEGSADFDELTRILTDQGVEQALAWLESRRGNILADVRADLASAEAAVAAAKERARARLQPLLKGAQLAHAEGDEARAESLFRDVLQADPDWGDARFRFVEFLTYTKGPRRETHATLAEAAEVYEEAHRNAERLVEADGENLEWLRELSVGHARLGDIAIARGDLEAAARHFGDSLKIREKLAQSDPGNSEWQRDLSYSYYIIGNLWRGQEEWAKALPFLKKSLEITEKLAKQDPSNATWQKDWESDKRLVQEVRAKLGN